MGFFPQIEHKYKHLQNKQMKNIMKPFQAFSFNPAVPIHNLASWFYFSAFLKRLLIQLILLAISCQPVFRWYELGMSELISFSAHLLCGKGKEQTLLQKKKKKKNHSRLELHFVPLKNEIFFMEIYYFYLCELSS